MSSSLTLVMSYYDQPQMLDVWWEYLLNYSDDVRSNVHFIFVDDASPTFPIMVPQTVVDRVSIELYRVDQDIPWNQPGARNLAMKHVTGWVLATDPDHIPSDHLLRRLLAYDFHRGHFYRPVRHRNQDRTPIRVPPTNVFVVHNEDYWEAGGYDEDFCGQKGFSDILLLQGLVAGCGFISEELDQEFSIDCYCEVLSLRKGGSGVSGAGQNCEGYIEIPDAAVLTLNRNMKNNLRLKREKLTQIQECGWAAYIKGQRPLRFPWHKVEAH